MVSLELPIVYWFVNKFCFGYTMLFYVLVFSLLQQGIHLWAVINSLSSVPLGNLTLIGEVKQVVQNYTAMNAGYLIEVQNDEECQDS